MALSTRRFPTGKRGVEEILKEATIRWFHTVELCEIFANYGRLGIFISKPGERPQNGLLFVIKNDKLKEFRRDGHNWGKRKDGKTILEGHEKLKVGGVDMLHCYYACGAENRNFKRHTYRMIKGQHSELVLFHYREQKENTKNCKRKKTEETIQYSRQEVEEVLSNLDSPGSSCGLPEIFEYIELEKWFWQKVAEGYLSEIHLAAACGYDEVLEAIVDAAETNINFTDKNDWTALHWAAYFGRMHTVELLISKGAVPGVLSIPTPNYPGGERPADLAFFAGHKEIGDYLEKQEELWLASMVGTY